MYIVYIYYSNVSIQIQLVVPKIIAPVTVGYDDKMVLQKAVSAELLLSEAFALLIVVISCCCTTSIVFETCIDAVPSKNPFRVEVGDALSVLVGVAGIFSAGAGTSAGVLVVVVVVVVMRAAGAAVRPSCCVGTAVGLIVVGDTVGYCVGPIVGKFVGGLVVHFSQFI